MKVVKRIFQVLAGLWLLAVLVLGIGSAWLQNNPEAAIEVISDITGLDPPETYRSATPTMEERERERAEKRARDAGWGEGQSLSGEAKF